MRKPRTLTGWSARPTNSKTPSPRQRARSPLRYIRPPAAPKRSATKRSPVRPPRPTYPRPTPTTAQYIDPVVGQRTTDRDARTGLLTFDSKSNGIDRSFGRTVKIGDMRNLQMARNLLRKRPREDLTSQHQMAQAGVVRSTMNDRFQIGRYATHKSYVIPHQLMPELRRRFPDRVADNDCCPAPDERQQRLLA